MKKSELRKIYLAKQQALSPAERDEASASIGVQFFRNCSLANVNTLHLFLTIDKFGEVNTTPIIHCVWKNFPQVRIVVPRVNFETGEMESVHYTAESEIENNRWLIPEPIEGELVQPAKIDMVLVPGLAFDWQGQRVGYGKGFYDRFLTNCRRDCRKVGLSFFEPVDKIDDAYEGDVALDLILTASVVHRPVPHA